MALEIDVQICGHYVWSVIIGMYKILVAIEKGLNAF